MSVKKVLKFKSGKKASETEAKKAVTVEGKITKGKPLFMNFIIFLKKKLQ